MSRTSTMIKVIGTSDYFHLWVHLFRPSPTDSPCQLAFMPESSVSLSEISHYVPFSVWNGFRNHQRTTDKQEALGPCLLWRAAGTCLSRLSVHPRAEKLQAVSYMTELRIQKGGNFMPQDIHYITSVSWTNWMGCLGSRLCQINVKIVTLWNTSVLRKRTGMFNDQGL